MVQHADLCEGGPVAIIGIESVVYGVEDVSTCARYWRDFGLIPLAERDDRAEFIVPSGSRVIVCRADDPSLPPSYFPGSGVREVCFGVSTPDDLQKLVDNLLQDRTVKIDADGAAHFVADDGTPMALRVWHKRPVVSSPDPTNAPGNIKRFNLHRQWRLRALPKTINHIVYFSDDYVASFEFVRDRLGFRLSDHIKGMGPFARAPGTHEHHTLFWVATDAFPQAAGRKGCAHVAFGIDDIDELMIGLNYMAERGWSTGNRGIETLNRHRVSSALYAYLDCPAGGFAEYHADTDYLDDNWIPRVWGIDCASFMWRGSLKAGPKRDTVEWDVALDPNGASLEAFRKRRSAE